MKILIKGYYGFGNLGDDLLLIFFYRIIKKYFEDAEIFVFSNASKNNKDFKLESNYNEYITRVIDIKKENIIDWTYQGEFDIIINGGGGTFFDYTQASNIKKIANSLISLFAPKTVFTIEQTIRKILHKQSNLQFKKHYAIGNNVGPFDTNSNRFVQLYSKIGSIDHFLVRDNDSEYYLNKINYTGGFEKIHDVVFSRSYFPEIKEKTTNNEIKTIGIVLMNWKNQGKKYLSKFDMLTKKLNENNIQVKYFAFSELDDKILNEYTNYDIILWKPNKNTLESYLNDFSSIDLCISMRFHGLVIANCMGIPCIGVGINNKISDFTNQTTDANELVKDDFEVETLFSLINKINSEYLQYVKYVKSITNKFQTMEKSVENFIYKIKQGSL